MSLYLFYLTLLASAFIRKIKLSHASTNNFSYLRQPFRNKRNVDKIRNRLFSSTSYHTPRKNSFYKTIYRSSDNWLLVGPKVRRDLNTAIPIHNCDNIVSFLYGYFMFRRLKVNFYPADIKIITIIKARPFL